MFHRMKKAQGFRQGLIVSVVAALSFAMAPAVADEATETTTATETTASETTASETAMVEEVEEPVDEEPTVEEPVVADKLGVELTEIAAPDADGIGEYQLRIDRGSVTLVHDGAHVRSEELAAQDENGEDVAVAIAELEDGRQILSVGEAESVTVTYLAEGKDSAAAWAEYDGSETAFDLAPAAQLSPRAMAVRAAASQGVSPDTSYQGASATISDTYIRLSGTTEGRDTDGQPSRPNSGPLSDPDFGAGIEQLKDYTAASDPNQPYPIRHRNWAVDQYKGGTADRPIRGPSRGDVSPGNRSEGMVNKNGEQGRYYSRDHVQYAWRENGGNGDMTMRADEYLMGGGDDGGVFFGGFYKMPGSLSQPVFTLTDNYQSSGKPSFRLFIDGVLNTEEPGWTVQKGVVSSRTALYFVSPDGKLGMMVEENARNEVMIRYYDNVRMDQLRGRKTVFNYLTTGGVKDFPIVGIRVPGWQRTVISYGTTNEATSGAASDPVTRMTNVQNANGYRTTGFIPTFGTDPQAPLTIDKSVSAAPAVGRNSVDYQVKVSNMDAGTVKASTRSFRVTDSPKFSPSVKIDRVVRVEANGTETTLTAGEKGYEIASGTIAANETKNFTVRVYFTPGTATDALTCNGANTGAYNEAQVFAGTSTTPMATDDACAPIPNAPNLEFQKTNAATAAVQGNEDQLWATYDVIVRNPANGVARTYRDLLDTPSFAPGATIREFTASSTQSAALATPVQQGQSWRLTRENTPISIAPGTSHVYKIRVRVDKLPAGTSAADLQCVNGAANRGLLNKAQITAGEATLTGEACVNAQAKPGKPVIEKDVNGTVTELGDGEAQVSYTVRVRNDAPGAIDRRVDVTDSPRFGAAVGEPKWMEVRLPGSSQWQLLAGLNNNYTLDSGRTIAAGQVLTYEVRATFTMPKPGVAEEQLQCSATTGGEGSGLFNKATVNYGTGTAEDSDCTAIPPSFEAPTVEKLAGDVTPIADRPGFSAVEYTVRAILPENGKATTVNVVDQPDFGGTAVDTFEVFRDGNWVTLAPENGRYVLGRDVELQPGDVQEYTVRITLRNAPVTTPEQDLTCAADPQPGRGLFNAVTMTWPGGEADDEACAPTPQDDPLAEILVEKTDTDRAPLPRDTGWQFQLFYLGADGKQQGELVSEMDTPFDGRDSAVTSGQTLRAGHYQLVETRAPNGFQLLPTALQLEVAFDGAQPQVSVVNAADFPGVQLTASGDAWIVQVADVRSGTLPLTGGRGIWIFILAAAVVLALALFIRRRQ